MPEALLRSPLRLFAPAKINLGLEILGRRTDGYHEVVTVLETISIFDIIDIHPSDRLQVTTSESIAVEDDLVRLAVDRLSERCGVELRLDVTVFKRIPIAAGLGGGSSDAGTVLSAIGTLLDINQEVVLDVAASLGSDVPFFLRGGVALATGTGADLASIDAPGRRWYVIVIPDLDIPGKTAQLYSELDEEDFTNGGVTRAFASDLTSDTAIEASSLYNAFQRPLWTRPEVRAAADTLTEAGAAAVLPCGAGPAVFTICSTYREASHLAKRAREEGASVHVATSVGPEPNLGRILACKPARETLSGR